MKTRILFIAILTFVVSHAVSAQELDPNNKRGFEPGKVYNFFGLDSVSTFSGNLNLAIPIGQGYGVSPGFSYQLMLSYNSKLWDFARETLPEGQARVAIPEKYSNAGLGWFLSIGRMLVPPEAGYTYVSPDGAHHDFSASLGARTSTETGVYYSNDSTYMRMMLTPRDAAPGAATSIQLETRDGLIHTFTGAGVLTKISDRYGNWLEVVPQGLVWTFNEGRGEGSTRKVARTHSVEFENAPAGRYAHPNFKQRVKTVKLAAFRLSGQTAADARATYTFHYDDTAVVDGRSCSTSTPTYPTPAYNVPLLKKIEVPDGSTFEMTYDLAESTICTSGSIVKLTLPTKGSIAWAYGEYPMSRDVCIFDEVYTGDIWHDSYSGVTKRTLTAHDGSVLEETGYTPELVQRPERATIRCGKKPSDVHENFPLPSKLFKNAVKSRSGAKTEHYFSAFRAREAQYAVPDAHESDYGLPLTRTEVLDAIPLSTKTYNATGTVLRTAYAEYETDGSLGTSQINQRLELMRTVFNDDDGDADFDADGKDTKAKRCKDGSGAVTQCWIQQANSDFDGFGHYRTQETSSNYVGAMDRSTFTNFNPGLTSTSPWPSSTSWLLETYSGSSVSENGQTLSATATFDSATGTLISTQTGTGNGSLLAATCHDASGFVSSQRWLGGEDPATGTARTIPTDPCSASRRDGEAILTHTYTFTDGALTGHIAKWEATAHEVVDETLDSNTGLPSSTRDSADLTTTYAFDTSGRITSLDPPGIAATTFTYANASVTTEGVFTPASAEARTTSSDVNLGDIAKQYQYDSVGRQWREKTLMPDNTWSVRETKYNTDGHKLSVSEAEKLVIPANKREYDFVPSHWTNFTGYDPFGRPTVITAPDDTVMSLTYRGARVTTRTAKVATTLDAQIDVATVEQIDAHGRLATVSEADTTTIYAYHVSGKLASVAMTAGTMTQDRTFTYDSRGLLTGETHPELGATGGGSVAYSRFDARGQSRRKRTGNSNKFDLTVEYDPAGRLTKITNTISAQVLKQFQFDPDNGRLDATARYNVMPHLGTVAVTEGWQYDSATGLPERRDITVGTSAFFTTGRTFAHTQFYNDLGLVREVGYPFDTTTHATAQRSVAYTHTNGLLTGVTGWATISYQPNGAIASVTHNGAVAETWTADPDGMPRPRKITVAKGAATHWTTGDYSFDGTGSISGIGTASYAYDRSGRLTTWREGAANGAHYRHSILYDAFGNRQTTTIRGCVASLQCYTSSVVSRHVASATNHYDDATYDAAGNVLTDGGRTFTYDSLGMTTSVIAGGRTFVYMYTAADERITAVERLANAAQLVTWTPRGFGNELLSVWTGNTWKEDEIWRGSSLVGMLNSVGKRHYSLDHVGSPRVITDDAGNLVGTQKFTPFGSGGAVGSGALQFTGHERDRANLAGGSVNLPDYAHARLLDVDAGRLLSIDPGPAELQRPQTWNRYSYVLNNPLLYTDPTGSVYELYGFVNDVDEQRFFQALSAKTGLTVVNNNGKLDYARDADGNAIIATDANGNQIGSATARKDLMNGINSATRYVVQRTDNNANVDMGVRSGALIRLDFADMRQINTGQNAAATFDSSMIFLHEGVGHAFLGLKDPGRNVLRQQPTLMGPTVVWENKIRTELGLPHRNQYRADVHRNGKRYIPFANGPVWLP